MMVLLVEDAPKTTTAIQLSLEADAYDAGTGLMPHLHPALWVGICAVEKDTLNTRIDPLLP